MTKLQKFFNENLGEVRVLLENGEAWFVAADVCKALDLTNVSKAISRIEADERLTLTISKGQFGGGPNMFNCVNEAGLWRLVLTSRQKQASALKRWLVHTILPAIRKNGGYIEGQENLPSGTRAALETQIKKLSKEVDYMTSKVTFLEEENEALRWESEVRHREAYSRAYAIYANDDND